MILYEASWCSRLSLSHIETDLEVVARQGYRLPGEGKPIKANTCSASAVKALNSPFSYPREKVLKSVQLCVMTNPMNPRPGQITEAKRAVVLDPFPSQASNQRLWSIRALSVWIVPTYHYIETALPGDQ